MKKTITVIITVIILLGLAGAVVWLFMSGKLVWVGNDNKQIVSSTSAIICNDETVTKYNSAMTMMVRGNDSAEYTIDEKGVDALNADIKTRSGYENDPTCQTILFWTAVYHQQYDPAKTANDKIQELHAKHIYADSNIQGNAPVSTYEGVLKSISAETNQKPATPLGD